jgi:hypothetical protein
VGSCKLELTTAVTQSPARTVNPPTALVASLIAVGVGDRRLLVARLLHLLPTSRPPRNKGSWITSAQLQSNRIDHAVGEALVPKHERVEARGRQLEAGSERPPVGTSRGK